MRKIFQTTALLLTVVLLTASLLTPALAASAAEFTAACDEAAADAGAAIVYDMTNNTILYGKNIDREISVASITKVLNACTASQYFDADDVITVGREIWLIIPEASVAPVEYGERYTFEQLLHAMLLPSGCDVAYVLAAAAGRKAAGDSSLSAEDAVDVFIDEMNRFLDKLNCTDSHFETPDGQDRSGQYTTCRDYVRVLRYAMQHELISSVVCKSGYSCRDLDGNYHYWETTNGTVAEDSRYYYPGAKGIKTGTTPWAGYCLAVAAERNGRTLISLVTNTSSLANRYQTTIDLLDLAFDFRLKGDVDGDNRVTPADARLTLRASVRLERLEDYDFYLADLDADGYLTPEDARLVLRVAIGLLIPA